MGDSTDPGLVPENNHLVPNTQETISMMKEKRDPKVLKLESWPAPRSAPSPNRIDESFSLEESKRQRS